MTGHRIWAENDVDNVLAMLSIKIGLMGAGRMATALARGLVHAKVVPAKAIVACDPTASVTAEALREQARADLGYKAPKLIVLHAQLPRTANGKIDKAALKRELMQEKTDAQR